MKKIIAILAVLSLVVSVTVSCASGTAAGTNTQSSVTGNSSVDSSSVVSSDMTDSANGGTEEGSSTNKSELKFDSKAAGETEIKAEAQTSLTALYAELIKDVPESAAKFLDAAYLVARFEIATVAGDDAALKSKAVAIYADVVKVYNSLENSGDELSVAKKKIADTVDAIYDLFVSAGESAEKTVEIKARLDGIKDEIDLANDKEAIETIKSGSAEIFRSLVVDYVSDKVGEALALAKTVAKDKLAGIYSTANDIFSDAVLKERLDLFYDDEIKKIDAVAEIGDVHVVLNSSAYDLKVFLSDLVMEKIGDLKTQAIEELDEAINALTEKIENENIKQQVRDFYAQEIAKINAVETLDGAGETLEEVKADTATFVKDMIATVVSELKTKAIGELDKVVGNAISKLKSDELKTELNDFYTTEKQKLDAVESIEQAQTVIAEVVSDVKNFALRLVASQTAELRQTVKGYVSALSAAFDYSPYSFVPDAMQPAYQNNYVNASLNYDFTDFVNVSSINYGGFGEQWHMVVDNIDQSRNFCKYLNGGESVISLSVATVGNYLDGEYSETVDCEFETEKFYVSLTYSDGVVEYVLQFKVGINIPLFGEVTPTLEATYNVNDNIKSVYISVNEKNALRYEMTENSYEFGMELSLSAYTRTSYISFTKSGPSVTGHIYEYNTVKGKDLIKSCADFYIGSDYVSVVGNKASGITGFKGYINELYDVRYGKLLGYEIRETLTFAGISGTYNTLWFNLSDISGIESVKAVEKDGHKPNENPHYVYVNGSDGVFKPTYNYIKKVVKTSRKYDIELRKRYFYALGGDGKLVEIEVEIPMMFIQEDNDKDTNYTDYPSDVSKENGISSSVTLSPVYLNKILSDYDTLIDEFIENKDKISGEYISAYVKG